MTREEATQCLAACEANMRTWKPEHREEVYFVVGQLMRMLRRHNRDFAKIALALVSAEMAGIRADDVIDADAHLQITDHP
jgi:trans-aconitate methyltransferase